MKEAVKYHVLPIDDRVVERVNAKLAGRPDLMGDRTSLTLHAGMKGMSENVFINIKNRSLTITADVEIPPGGANGVILAQGGRFGGWSLYMKGGKPIYVYNFLGLQRFTVASPQAVPAGKATIRLEFAYDGGGLGKGGLATIYVNDKKVAEGRIERTQPMIFSADETADVGEDDATPVTEDYKAYDNKFTGKILKVTVDVKEMGAGVQAEAAKAGAEAARSWKPRSNLDEMSGKRQRQQGRSASATHGQQRSQRRPVLCRSSVVAADAASALLCWGHRAVVSASPGTRNWTSRHRPLQIPSVAQVAGRERQKPSVYAWVAVRAGSARRWNGKIAIKGDLADADSRTS